MQAPDEPVSTGSYSPEEALAIAMSTTRAGSSWTMDVHMAAAPDAVEHLRRLGFELRRIPRTIEPGAPDHSATKLAKLAGARQ